MMSTCLIFVILIVLCPYQIKTDYTVSAGLKQNVIVLGEDIVIVCSAMGNIGSKTRQWTKVFDFAVISVNEVVTDVHKYTQKLVFRNETLIIFTLTIHNFTELDFNTYRCVYGAKETEVALDMIENYISMPDENTTVHYNFDQSNNTLDVDVRIPKVYPTPTCWMSLHNKELQVPVVAKNMLGKFYNVTIKKSFVIGKDDCGYVAIVCLIGPRTDWLNTKFKINCMKVGNDRTQSDSSKSYLKVIIVLSCVLGGCLVMGFVFWIKLRRSKYKKRKKKMNKKNGTETQDILLRKRSSEISIEADALKCPN